MTFYQILLFSNGADEQVLRLQNTLLRRVQDLGCDERAIKILREHQLHSIDEKAPLVTAYISLVENPPSVPALAAMVKSGIFVVPVVKQLGRFRDFVFEDLLPINGIGVTAEDPNLERVANTLLEALGMLRRSRRLFISYRRVETQTVAIQLYELLDARGFDVFLDTHSIQPGEPFQEVLWHRLADTDVVVMLDSPGFLESHWTAEELTKANSTNIQILQVVWPNHRLHDATAFSRPFMLKEGDFHDSNVGTGASLQSQIAEDIVTEVESLRARALAARHAYLVQEFCAEAADCGVKAHIQPERFITMEINQNTFIIVVPTVGVPDAVQYQEIEENLQAHVAENAELILLYDERGIRDKWIAHIDWLDRHKLRARSLQVAQATAWLRQHL